MLAKKDFKFVDILWIDCLHQNYLKKIVKHKYLVYRIADNISCFSNTGPNLLLAYEELIDCADLILVFSKIICEELQQKYGNKKFVYCSNGVDLFNFIRETYNKLDEYKKLEGKIALYIGAIDEWFDIELLDYLARNMLETNFVIIGCDKLNILKRVVRSNVIYLGSKNPELIAEYIYYSDFGIIPFRQTKLVQTVNSIKMYEFFSLGKLVVSTRWNELDAINAPCLLANNAHEFLDMLNDSVDNKKTNAFYLMFYAKENTWDERIKYILKISAYI